MVALSTLRARPGGGREHRSNRFARECSLVSFPPLTNRAAMSDVSCGKCGIVLDEPINIRPENRSPCPQCGGTTRVYGLSPIPVLTTEDLGGANAAFREVALQNTIIVQGLLLPTSSAVRSRAIQAIAIPWLEIVEVIHRDPRSVYATPPDKWEEIIAGAFIKAGFEEVRLAPRL